MTRREGIFLTSLEFTLTLTLEIGYHPVTFFFYLMNIFNDTTFISPQQTTSCKIYIKNKIEINQRRDILLFPNAVAWKTASNVF